MVMTMMMMMMIIPEVPNGEEWQANLGLADYLGITSNFQPPNYWNGITDKGTTLVQDIMKCDGKQVKNEKQ